MKAGLSSSPDSGPDSSPDSSPSTGAHARAPVMKDLGEQLPSGRVRCMYRGCGKVCASWFGLTIHFKRSHGKRLGEAEWGDVECR